MGTRSENRHKQQIRRRIIFFIILILIIAAAAFGVYKFVSSNNDSNPSSGNDKKSDSKAEESSILPNISLDILCVGDVIVHSTQTASAKQSDGTYNFTENFTYIKPYIEAADLSICNIEGTFGGTPYTGYPLFSMPDSMATTLKDTGFDVGVTSNNHMLDKGKNGIIRTIEVVKNSGMLVTGGVSDPSEKDYIVTEIKGVKIGIVAYTYETPLVNGGRTINGITLSDENRSLINSFSWQSLDEDMLAVKTSIDGARADGAEIIICYMHWGEEYERQPNVHQKKAATFLSDYGADIIFASHPHVLQTFELIKTTSGDRQVPIFWSMGNLISNQRLETLSNRYLEQGMIAKVNLEYNPNDGSIPKLEMGYIGTWVDKYQSGGRNVYSIIPLDADYLSNPTLTASGHTKRATQALDDMKQLFETGAATAYAYS